MASELQRRKVTGVVRAMDANGDGFLEEMDFTQLTARWAEIRGAAPGSDEYGRLSSVMMGWWHTLLGASGEPPVDKITLDDVLTVVDELGRMRDAVAATADIMFDVIDEDRDGRISAAEYKQLIEAWNGRATGTDDIFPLLDGDGHLSHGEFRELWTEFWAGDNADSPGTWVFGRFPLPTMQDH
ncbi:MAG TPA: EF-hand domain-containing protein [Actinophytocola sp.]